MDRSRALDAVGRAIGSRKLVWFGTRGTDAQPLLALPQFTRLYSQIAPMGAISLEDEACLETMRNQRVDLDVYDFDQDRSPEAGALRELVAQAVAARSVLVAYRPSEFISTLAFLQSSAVEYFGLFHEQQAPFEHKPWVETELSKLPKPVPTVPWTYHSRREDLTRALVRRGVVVMRRSRSSGGSGVALVRSADEAQAAVGQDSFFALAPYYEDALPLNVNAVVFADGTVSLHAPSVQLIGIPNCTSRPFGYCGNDFAALKAADPAILDQLESIVRDVGRWLATMGYRGAFGIDALAAGGKVMFSELNARFQGSSAACAWLDGAIGRHDMYLAHLGAFLEIECADEASLRDLVAAYPELSQVITHNTGAPRRAATLTYPKPECDATAIPDDGVLVDHGAIARRLIVRGSVTRTGRGLEGPARDWAREALSPALDA